MENHLPSALHPIMIAISIGVGLLLSRVLNRFVTRPPRFSAVVTLSLAALVSLWIGISTDLLNAYGFVIRLNYVLFGFFIGLAASIALRLGNHRRAVTKL